MLAYMIMNKINGKGYVGITTRTLCRRWHEHVNVPHSSAKYLHRAIQKHGSDSFDIYPIASAVGDLSNLKELEKILISQFETFAPNGYNLTLGGDGVFGYKQTAEQAEKSRTLRLGVKHSEETKKKMSCAHSGENNHFFGRRHSEETKNAYQRQKRDVLVLGLVKQEVKKPRKRYPRQTKEFQNRTPRKQNLKFLWRRRDENKHLQVRKLAGNCLSLSKNLGRCDAKTL